MDIQLLAFLPEALANDPLGLFLLLCIACFVLLSIGIAVLAILFP